MAFVKLDTGILRSTIWFDKEARDVFLTALLMAEPVELEQPTAQIEVRSLEATGWTVPPGWYGFVPAASVGIIHMAGVGEDEGMAALERLGSPESDSRSQAFEGRRLVRIDGGYLVLNFMRYREKDHTAALRMRRLRAKKQAERDAVTEPSDAVTGRTVTEGREQSTEAYNNGKPILPPVSRERQADLDEAKACEATCREYMALTGKAMDEVLWGFSEVNGKRLVRLDTPNVKWLRVTHDRIRAALIEARQEKRKPAGEDPLVKIRRIEAAREARMKGGAA